jgi:hypothetical protein
VDPALSAAVARTLHPGTSSDQRAAVFADPSQVLQFATPWGLTVGTTTKPRLHTPENSTNTVIISSYSDTIGQWYPVQQPLADGRGFFTSLTRRREAEALGLPILTVDPATLPGPPDENGDQPDGTLDRLNFIGGDNPGDRPVIAAFPTNLPMAPGQTFPFGVKLNEVADSVEFPLLGPWARSLLYIKQHNQNQSVTLGGPLFHIPDEGLPLPADGIDPFRNVTILPRFPADPVPLTPASTPFRLVTETINTLSDATWRDLGGRLGPLPLGGPPQNTGGNNGITPEQIKTIFKVQNRPAEKSLKEREQAELAAETEIFYKLMFGSLPAKDSTTQDQIVLATIQEPFKLVLQKNGPVTAAATF